MSAFRFSIRTLFLLGWLAQLTACLGGASGLENESIDGGTFSSLPNPAILIANGGAGTASIIDPSTLSVVSSVPVESGFHPHHLGESPDGGRVLMTATRADLSMGHSGGHHGHGAGSPETIVYLIDLTSREMRSVIRQAATAHNAAYTVDGRELVLSLNEQDKVQAYDVASFQPTWSAAVGRLPLEVTPAKEGKTLVVANSGDASLALVDLPSHSVRATLPVGEVPVAAWLSQDGSLHVSNEEGKSVSMLSSDLSRVSITVDVMGAPGQAFVTPDGGELWIAVEDRAVLAIYDACTHSKLSEFSAGTKPHGIAFEPSGKRAFITDEEGSRVLVVDVASRAITGEIPVGSKPNGILWLERSASGVPTGEPMPHECPKPQRPTQRSNQY